jgi:hypothetical protein
VKRLSTWDTYVREASKEGDRSIELPLTEDEVFIVRYPTRRQAREIANAQRVGDVDGLLVAMLGETAGKRVAELAEDQPSYVLDEFLLDVMKKFGMLPDDDSSDAEDAGGEQEGKSVTLKSKTASKRSSAA